MQANITRNSELNYPQNLQHPLSISCSTVLPGGWRNHFATPIHLLVDCNRPQCEPYDPSGRFLSSLVPSGKFLRTTQIASLLLVSLSLPVPHVAGMGTDSFELVDLGLWRYFYLSNNEMNDWMELSGLGMSAKVSILHKCENAGVSSLFYFSSLHCYCVSTATVYPLLSVSTA